MTTSTNTSPDIQRDTLLTAAIRLTGILPVTQAPKPELLELAALHLTMEMEALQATGKILRTVERTSLPLVSGTSE